MNPHTGEIFYSAEPPFFSGSPVPDAYYAYPTPHEYGRGEPAHLSPQAQEFVPSSIDFIPHGPQASQVWRQKPQGHRHDNRVSHAQLFRLLNLPSEEVVATEAINLLPCSWFISIGHGQW